MPTIEAMTIHINNNDKECHPWLRDMAHLPHRPSLADIRDLEHHFCRDFTCCGQTLGDLHDLLEHYEECHVRLEEDERTSLETEDNQPNLDDTIISENLEVTRPATPLLALKRANEEESDHLQPIAPSAISNIGTHGHKRQRSVPPDLSPLSIDTLHVPTSFSATATPTSLGEDFLAKAGLDVASSTLASITTQDGIVSMHLFIFGRHNLFCQIMIHFAINYGQLTLLSSIVNANKPFKCTVPGCEKAYKNPNGLKYHNLHGHHGNDESDTERRLQRPFECTIGSCRKRYKNLNGLKYHVEHSHLVVITNQLNNILPQTPELSPASTP
ncbi:hypothetical protein NQZ79_g1348 [Umbelopsis isabellina]|nr:hypothetical protein NQZ79_g1348 [Umbelopsis isabellina]